MKKVLFVTFIAVGFGCIGGFGSKANLAWGGQIVFVSKAFNPDTRIVIINADGTAPQPLKSKPVPNWPTWSPDGKKLHLSPMRLTNFSRWMQMVVISNV